MCKWSTAYYAELFPRLQIHHGVEDIAVPVAHSDRLVDALETVPDGDYVYYRYPEGNHNPATLPDCWPRVRELLLDFLE
jgi:dipeptidyl aminopeptidase/acylaminoacyl peptidase